MFLLILFNNQGKDTPFSGHCKVQNINKRGFPVQNTERAENKKSTRFWSILSDFKRKNACFYENWLVFA